MLESVRRIWDRSEYSSFTDLCRHNGRWVCVFREGVAHAGDIGCVRVIVSDDGEQWASAALLAMDGVDLRDPKISIAPDGRLMLLIGGAINPSDDPGGTSSDVLNQSFVTFSDDGRVWTPLVQVVPDGHWLWRVTWHRGSAYGVSKLGTGDTPKRGFLWKSDDGLAYNVIHEFNVPGMSETTLRFTDDDEVISLTRRTGPGGGHGWTGTASPPYAEWIWQPTDYRFGGPNFIILPDGRMWAGSRIYGDTARTGLFRMTRTSFDVALVLPSGGDTSYPGMVWHDGLLWMSYYSQHEGKPCIYLARVHLDE
jgi:hypothetical protein